jgi:hypothetical protein
MWVAKFVAHLLTTAALSGFESRHLSKNTKWTTYAKEWPTHSNPPENIQKNIMTGKSTYTGDVFHTWHNLRV